MQAVVRPMSYQVKEIFYTLQGEGANAGRPAVFCRFAGCNLWSGREQDRAIAACNFCDTDFVGTDGTLGGKFADANALADIIAAQWPSVDPAYFGGYMNDNFTQTFAATGLQAEHAYTLARNSFEASFIEASAKRRYVDQLDACFATFQ